MPGPALRIADDPAVAMGVRPAVRVKKAAALLDMNEAHVRELVDRGELESFRIGRRGIRIYLDAIADYQKRGARRARAGVPGVDAGPRRNVTSSAKYREAVAALRRMGVL